MKSWTNYLGVEDMAAVINHTAGGYLFYKTPEYHRISRFRGNGVPMDGRDSMYTSEIMRRRIIIPSPGILTDDGHSPWGECIAVGRNDP